MMHPHLLDDKDEFEALDDRDEFVREVNETFFFAETNAKHCAARFMNDFWHVEILQVTDYNGRTFWNVRASR